MSSSPTLHPQISVIAHFWTQSLNFKWTVLEDYWELEARTGTVGKLQVSTFPFSEYVFSKIKTLPLKGDKTVWICSQNEWKSDPKHNCGTTFSHPQYGSRVSLGFHPPCPSRTFDLFMSLSQNFKFDIKGNEVVVAECGTMWGCCSKLRSISSIWGSSARSDPNTLGFTAIWKKCAKQLKSTNFRVRSWMRGSLPAIVILISLVLMPVHFTYGTEPFYFYWTLFYVSYSEKHCSGTWRTDRLV